MNGGNLLLLALVRQPLNRHDKFRERPGDLERAPTVCRGA
jgi:hypothetical protein